MNYTRTAIGLLSRQYRSVLLKCALINLGIFAFMGTANAETEITAEYLNSVTQFNDRVVWEQSAATGADTVKIGDKYFKYTYTQPSAYTDAPARLADADITAEAVNNKVFDGFASTGGSGGAIYNSIDNSGVNITSDFLNNSAASSTSTNHYGNAIYNGGTYSAHAKLGNISGVFINNSITETSGGGTLSGGVIENAYGDIGNITADFIANVNLGNGNSSGGVIFNSDGTIGNVSGSFIGNEFTSGSIHVLAGGVIRSSGSTAVINDISSNFIGNSIQHGATFDSMMGGIILNDEGSQIGKISGDFLYNDISFNTNNYVLGGLIYNADKNGYCSTIEEISGNFEHNVISGNAPYAIYGGAIANYYNSVSDNRINTLSANFSDNTVSVGYFIMGFIYNESKIGDITGDYKNNVLETDTVYGGILNYGGTINKIEGSTFENNTANGKDTALGAAITNMGVITEGIVNAKFLNNKAISDTAANGAAIYMSSADLKIAADGSVGDGISTFQGNYTQITGGEKKYEAIRVSGAARTLTLEAKNNGIINLYDYIDGSTGYDTVITGDATGTVNLYNDIKNSDVSVEKVNVSTADGTLHDYELLSLTVDANANWKIDVDAKNKTADTLATDANSATASIGTLTVNEISYVDSSQSDIAEGFKVQILKTQGTATATDLQLAVGEDLAEEFVISQKEETVNDEVTANTKWADEFKKTGTITTTSGQFGLATTDTFNDSIGVTISTETEQVSEKLGDTLMLVNTAQLDEKNFTADKASDVYKAEDDLGTTYGKVNVIGKADGSSKSTVDLNGHDGFAMSEGSEIALKDVKLTGSSDSTIDIAPRAKISLDNAEISGVNLNVEGELDVAENEVSAKKATFGKSATLKLLVNDIKDDHGAFKADSFDIAEGATLDVTFGQNPLGGEKTGEVALLSLNDGSDIDNNNFADSFHNNMYNFVRKSDKSGIYGVFQTKTAEEISRENGGTKTNQEAAAAWVDGPSFGGGAAAEIADGLAGLAQNNGTAFNDELTALAPNDDGMVQAVSADITDRLLLTIDNHLIDEAKEEGLSSGDSKTRGYPDLSGVKTWIKAYYGEAKLQRRGDIHGFDTDSIGFIAGVDKKVTSNIKAGFGMQYDDTDIDAFKRDVDAKTLLGFIYGEYRPGKWFVNGTFGYGVTDYDEDKSVQDKKVHAHYKAELYSVQALTGYTFKYFTPEVGARYYQIKRHGYTDGALQSVSGKNMDLLRATAGVKAETTYGMYKPHAYFGAVYDLVSDRDNALVNLTNGASYTVHGKRLPRFGVELGAGVDVALTDRIEIGAGYEAKFRKDYQDHSGILKFKYNF